MGRWVMVVVMMLMVVNTVRAVGPVPEAAKAATEKYQSAVAGLTREQSEQILAAKQRHAEQLDQLLEKAKGAGDLDGVIKLRDEKEKVARSEGTVGGQAPTAAAAARRTYGNALKESEDKFRKTARSLLDEFLKELADIEKTETKADRIPSAQVVRAFRLERQKSGTPKLTIRENLLPDAAQGEWVDLLAWSEGVDWATRGIDWNARLESPPTRKGLKTKSGPEQTYLYPLPAIVDGDYELIAEFTRLSGQHDVGINLPVGIHNLILGLSGGSINGNGLVDGLGCIDGRWFNENETTRRPSRIQTGTKHRVRVTVERTSSQVKVEVDLDGTPKYLTWSGKESSLTNTMVGLLTTTCHPAVYISRGHAEFHTLRIRMMSGAIRRDVITDVDREQDRKNGFVRLVGEKMVAPQVGWAQLLINQIPGAEPGSTERLWPLITRDFKVCDDFYGAHAPSRLKCPIPTGAKSFSAIGYNDTSRTGKYLIYVDGKQVYDSGITDIATAKVDIPPKASMLELVIDPAGDKHQDHTYWCYPRFHSVSSDKVFDKMLDGKPGPLKFAIASNSVGEQSLTHNQPIGGLKSIPIHFRDAQPCDEFLFAHAPSSVTYTVPEGMIRYTAIGYNVQSHHVKYEVWADAKRIYESPQVGIVPIDVKLPTGTKTIELKINDLGDAGHGDRSMWCYPRLHRK